MDRQKLVINGIPAIVWGAPSDKVFIHTHGKMSRKEFAEEFAGVAEKAGWQTLSFDLPEHGERTDHTYRCDVWNGMTDLNIIADYAFSQWKTVSLFACSLGAYFALQTYPERNFDKILFQSPIVDMAWLVDRMRLWFNITEEQLEAEKEIETPIDSLRWDYYCYIKSHPIVRWPAGTRILYGALDDLQPYSSLAAFAERFDAVVTVAPTSHHPFMESEDGPVVADWIQKALAPEEE